MDLVILCITEPYRDQQWYLGLAGDTLILRNPARKVVKTYAVDNIGETILFPSGRESIQCIHCPQDDGVTVQFDARDEDLPKLDALMRRRRSFHVGKLRGRGRPLAIMGLLAAGWAALFWLAWGKGWWAGIAVTVFSLGFEAFFYRQYLDEKRLADWTSPGPGTKPLTEFKADETRRISDQHWID